MFLGLAIGFTALGTGCQHQKHAVDTEEARPPIPAYQGADMEASASQPKTTSRSPGSKPASVEERNVEDRVPRKLSAKQEGGEAFWILPGPRELSPTVFGTPGNPKRLVEPFIEQAKKEVEAGKAPPSVPELLDPKKGLPLLVGLPLDGPWGRSMMDGKWVVKHGSPFGDKMKPLKGDDHYFRITYHDRQLSDDKGKTFLDTKDSVEFNTKFKDPQGNSYEIKIAKTFKPPIPGWETEGGVLMNSEIGGDTGTFIPLLPRAYSYATVWGIGKIKVNDEKPVTRVTILFITETIRNDKGELALDEEMPLNKRGVQAHLLVPPIEPVPGMGPTKSPVPTPFKLPPKAPVEHQPFISVFFPEAKITGGAEYVRAHENK